MGCLQPGTDSAHGNSNLRADNSDPRHINAEQVETDQDASLRVNGRLAIEDAMRKWMYIPTAVSLVLFSISAWAQGPAPKNIKGESAKVLSAGETTSQPPKQVTEDPNYSIAPEDVLTIDVWKEPE